jgi:hypothetical protein
MFIAPSARSLMILLLSPNSKPGDRLDILRVRYVYACVHVTLLCSSIGDTLSLSTISYPIIYINYI